MPIRKSYRISGQTHLLPVIIDLDGPQGNAWMLMVEMSKRARLMGYTKEQIRDVRDRMMMKGYIDLIRVMDAEFPGAFEFTTDRIDLFDDLVEAGVSDTFNEVKKNES